MSVFLGTVENKVDRKGRVSVPATFRTILSGQGYAGVVAFPSLRLDGEAIDACSMDYMQRLSTSVGRLDKFSEEQEAFASFIFASAHQLPWDTEGRIMLPEALIGPAGITDRIAFVGGGETFQMWEPGRYAEHKAQLADRLRRDRRALKVDAGMEGAAR